MPATRDTIELAVLAALPPGGAVLAVSGGRDSMVLLAAAARVAPQRIASVATFDHGTGAHAREATALVERRATELGLAVTVGGAAAGLHTEAAWREARWRFLRDVSLRLSAPVTTAHTRDDQLETILIRVLRGAGARGLAALAAPGRVIRPLLGITRDDVVRYAAAHGVTFVHDPSNDSPAHLRNRVRHELLPALLGVAPSLDADLHRVAERAATLRGDIERFIDEHVPHALEDGELAVARSVLLHYDEGALRTLWPALAARAGATLDRRGTARLAGFAMHGVNGGRVQLSGGFEASLHRDALCVRRVRPASAASVRRPLRDDTRMGSWRFRSAHTGQELGSWEAALPTDATLTVRAWQPGDRMIAAGETAPRRLKGLLRDAGVAASDRIAWPVVLSGEEIVWVPGVRRGSAATDRSGMPVAWFRCERTND